MVAKAPEIPNLALNPLEKLDTIIFCYSNPSKTKIDMMLASYLSSHEEMSTTITTKRTRTRTTQSGDRPAGFAAGKKQWSSV